MKQSNRLALLLIIALLVLILAAEGWFYLQQVSGQNQLTQTLVEARQRLAAMNLEPLQSQKKQLDEQLSQIKAQSDEAKNKLSVSNTSISITNNLQTTAAACNVTITAINSTGSTKGDLDGVPIVSTPVEVKLFGTTSNITNFIAEVGKKFPTGIVKATEINVAAKPESPSPESGPGATSASISFVVYTYNGGER